MATTFLCENDASFERLNHFNAFSDEITGIEALLHEDLRIGESLRPNGLRFPQTEALQWRDSTPSPQYGAFETSGMTLKSLT